MSESHGAILSGLQSVVCHLCDKPGGFLYFCFQKTRLDHGFCACQRQDVAQVTIPRLFWYIAGIKPAKRDSMKPLSRKQIKQALETVPIDQVLSVPGELTHKQKEFARLVAMGETGSGAYRKAYNSKAKPTSVACEASKLRAHPSIAQTIEAFQLANEAQKYQTPAQLRALVLHSLVQVIIDPDAKHATKVQAAKVLGTVAEVGAFVTRTEHRIIKSSEDAKAQVLAKLREVLTDGATDAAIVDADSLVRELTAPGDEPAAQEGPPPTPQNAVQESHQTIHTIPHNQSESESTPVIFPSLEDELGVGNTPLSDLK